MDIRGSFVDHDGDGESEKAKPNSKGGGGVYFPRSSQPKKVSMAATVPPDDPQPKSRTVAKKGTTAKPQSSPMTGGRYMRSGAKGTLKNPYVTIERVHKKFMEDPVGAAKAAKPPYSLPVDPDIELDVPNWEKEKFVRSQAMMNDPMYLFVKMVASHVASKIDTLFTVADPAQPAKYTASSRHKRKQHDDIPVTVQPKSPMYTEVIKKKKLRVADILKHGDNIDEDQRNAVEESAMEAERYEQIEHEKSIVRDPSVTGIIYLSDSLYGAVVTAYQCLTSRYKHLANVHSKHFMTDENAAPRFAQVVACIMNKSKFSRGTMPHTKAQIDLEEDTLKQSFESFKFLKWDTNIKKFRHINSCDAGY